MISEVPISGKSDELSLCFLTKEKSFTLDQIQQLAQHFKVQPQVFLS
jgi:antitoxin component HigA of HigAB toxin-antitoxin module